MAIIGTFVGTPEVVVERSLEELIFDAVQRTVENAGRTVDDVDAVVISANDEIDGRVISCMVGSGPAAGVGRDLMMVASAGEHALIYGYLQLLAGRGRNVLVLSWSKPSESVVPEHAELVAAEPFLLRPHGMNDTIAAALQASALIGTERGLATDGRPADGFSSWPLRKADKRAAGDAVCGVLLAREDMIADEVAPVWIKGLGWSVDRYELGDRDVAEMGALRSAASRAYRMAEIDGAPSADSLVCMSCPSTIAFDAALRVLGLSRDNARVVGNGASGSLSFPTWPSGLSAMAETAQALRRIVVDGGRVRVGVSASLHGFASQGAVVGVFGSGMERGN